MEEYRDTTSYTDTAEQEILRIEDHNIPLADPQHNNDNHFIDQLPFGLITAVAMLAVLAGITAIVAVLLIK